MVMMAKVTSPSLTAGERVSRWLEKHMGLLLLLPASLIFLFLTVFPLFYNAYISFFEYAFILGF